MTIPKKPTKPTKPRKAAPKAADPLIARVEALEAQVAKLLARPVAEVGTVYKLVAAAPPSALVKLAPLDGMKFIARRNFEHAGLRFRMDEGVRDLPDADARVLFADDAIVPAQSTFSVEVRAEIETK